MTRPLIACLAVAVLAGPAKAEDVITLEPPAGVGFAGSALSVRRLKGHVRRLGGRAGALVDLTDYDQAGSLHAPMGLLVVGAGGAVAVVPRGRHALSLAGGGAPGTLLLLLRAEDGFRLQVQLEPTASPAAAPDRLDARGEVAPGDEWRVTLDAPTASAALTLRPLAAGAGAREGATVAAPAADEPADPSIAQPAEDGPRRRPSRADLIRQRLGERANAGAGTPDRNRPRRPR